MSEDKPSAWPEGQLELWLQQGYASVLRAVQRLGLSTAEAEDVIQDALIGLLGSERTFSSYDQFLAYLQTGARWRALDSWRRMFREATPESQLSEADRDRFFDHSVDDGVLDTNIFALELERQMAELPAKSLEVVRLSMVGLNSFEIAKQLGIKPASVRSLLRFARYRLAKGIKRE